MTDLKLYKGNKHVVVSAATVLDLMKVVATSEGMEDKYRREFAKYDRHIEVHPELVNAVKSFLHTNNLHNTHPTAMNAVTSPPDASSCFPKRD